MMLLEWLPVDTTYKNKTDYVYYTVFICKFKG